MIGRRAIAAAFLASATAAVAQDSVSLLSPPTSAILGAFTVDALPTCAPSNQGRYAFATDLGGGADTVLCDGSFWKHIRLGAPAVVAATSGTVTVTPLKTAPVLFVNAAGILSSMTLQIDPSGLYPGYVTYVRTTGALTGSLGIKIVGGATLPLLGNSTSMFIYDGTTLQRIQ